MHTNRSLREKLILAALAGILLRLFFIWRFPSTGGDTPLYEALAQNWLDHGVFGIFVDGRLVPTDLRPPGYPGFLAAVYGLFGRSQFAVMAAQAVTDTITCFLVAALAASLAGRTTQARVSPERVAVAAMWLAALCPFTANYVAVPLTEVLAIFFTVLTLLLLLKAWERSDRGGAHETNYTCWLLPGMAAGMGTLVRPETPLLLAAGGLVLAIYWLPRRQWLRLFRSGLWMAAGLALVLLPWGVRNMRTLGRPQFLAARYAEMPGEFVAHGFYNWTQTWLVRFRDVYLSIWKLEDEPIDINSLPARAFDSPEERERIAAILEDYNNTLTMTAQLDAQFAEIARERTRRHPLRTYLTVPAGRAVTMWLTPRVEQLPYSGHLWPPAARYEDDPVDFSVTVGLGALNIFYIALALTAVALALRRAGGIKTFFALEDPTSRGVALLAAFIVVRTLFFTQMEAPEPRYLLECYPAVIVLGALVPFLRAPI